MAEQLKRGIVVEGKGSQVRVRFADDDVVSGWLDVAQTSTGGTKMYRRPKPGSLVICGMDRNWESGVVLGSTYSDDNPAPRDSADTMFIELPDGSSFEFDEAAASCKVSMASGVSVGLQGTTCTIDGDVVITKKLTVQGDTSLAATKINGVEQVGN